VVRYPALMPRIVPSTIRPPDGPIEVRPAVTGDAGGLHALMDGIYQEDAWFVGDGPPDVRTLAGKIRSLDPSRAMLLVAEMHSGRAHRELIGWIEVRRLGYRRVEHVATLTLAVAARARRRGVGRMLLRAVEPWARRVGVLKLRLDVRAGNEAAIALYEAEGFEREGVERGLVRDEAGFEDNLIYGKFLTPEVTGEPDR